VLAGRAARFLDDGGDPERMLALAADRRAARRLATVLAAEDAGGVRPLGYVAFAQALIERHWPLVAAWLGMDAPEPVFLTFDLAQYACREEYRREPGALARLTIREPRLIVQLLDNLNLAAANGLTLDDAWARVAAGLGVRVDDPVMQDGRRITASFRARCIAAGVLPFDLQVEAAVWLLSQPEVLEQLARRYELLLVAGLDEFVPAVIGAVGRLARRIPNVAIGYSTDGGRTYTFELRDGIRYSNGEVVAAIDFRRALERGFPLNESAYEFFYGGLLGGEACVSEPGTCDLSKGIVTDDASRTITFHLVAPDPEFLYKLVDPFAYPVPSSAPDENQPSEGIPGTGPYMLEGPMTRDGVALVRNPYFHVWSPAAQPEGYVDRLEWTFGVEYEAQIDAVAAGDADVAFDAFLAPDRLDDLFVRSSAQVHTSPQAGTYFVVLNTEAPPFDDVDVRRDGGGAREARVVQDRPCILVGGQDRLGVGAVACDRRRAFQHRTAGERHEFHIGDVAVIQFLQYACAAWFYRRRLRRLGRLARPTDCHRPDLARDNDHPGYCSTGNCYHQPDERRLRQRVP
jgi:hypothetical protein